jgi:hypothetical protein
MARSMIQEWRARLADSDLPSTTKLVGLVWSLDANADGTNGHPGGARMASRCSLSKRAVFEHLGNLADPSNGWLREEFHGSFKGKNKAAKASEYAAVIPPVGDGGSPRAAVRGSGKTPPVGDGGSPRAAVRGHGSGTRGHGPLGDSDATKTGPVGDSDAQNTGSVGDGGSLQEKYYQYFDQGTPPASGSAGATPSAESSRTGKTKASDIRCACGEVGYVIGELPDGPVYECAVGHRTSLVWAEVGRPDWGPRPPVIDHGPDEIL